MVRFIDVNIWSTDTSDSVDIQRTAQSATLQDSSDVLVVVNLIEFYNLYVCIQIENHYNLYIDGDALQQCN